MAEKGGFSSTKFCTPYRQGDENLTFIKKMYVGFYVPCMH